MVELTYEDTRAINYINTNPVGIISGEEVYLDNIVAAALMAGLNLFFIGPQSTGKSQLARDFFNSWFGGKKWGLMAEGRADFSPSDLMEAMNLSLVHGRSETLPEMKPVFVDGQTKYLVQSIKEKDGQISPAWKLISEEERERIIHEYSQTTADIVSLVNLEKKFVVVEEFNRCPEVIMNMFYGLMTGEYIFRGKVYRLGNGYHAGIGTANPEDFSGTFKMDPGMWARWHVVIDFSAYEPTDEDFLRIASMNLEPRIRDSPQRDIVDKIEEIKSRIDSTKPTLEEKFILGYLSQGLNRCVNPSLRDSKNQNGWPLVCSTEECEYSSGICGAMKGLDNRASFTVFRLAKGLEQILRLKGVETFNPLETLLLAFEFVAPYKGVLSPKIVRQNKSEALAIRDYIGTIKEKLNDGLETIRSFGKRRDLPRKIDDLKSMLDKRGIDYKDAEEYLKKKYGAPIDVEKHEQYHKWRQEAIRALLLELDIGNFLDLVGKIVKLPENYQLLTDPNAFNSAYPNADHSASVKNAKEKIIKAAFSLQDAILPEIEKKVFELIPEESVKKKIEKEHGNVQVSENRKKAYEQELRNILTLRLEFFHKQEERERFEDFKASAFGFAAPLIKDFSGTQETEK